MSQAKLFGTGDNKKSIFEEGLGKLPEGEQIAAKLGIAVLLAVIVGGMTLLPIGTIADDAAEVGGDIEMQNMADQGDAEAVQAEQQMKLDFLPKKWGRFAALTISNILTNGSKLDSALNQKLKDGQPDTTQFGLWGDIFKAMGTSDEWASIGSGIFVLGGTLLTMGFSGALMLHPTSGSNRRRSRLAPG